MVNENISIKKATLINSAAKYYNVICTFVVSVILSRILSPEEYGVVAVVTVFITFFALFSDLGFGVAYIQNKELNEEDKNILFTFLVYIGVVLFVIFFFFSYGIAWFYEDKVYIRVSQLLGVNLFLTAVNVIPNAELLKRRKFKTVGIVQAVSGTIAALFAILFAMIGLSFYSIVLQGIINMAIMCVACMVITKTQFVFRIRKSTIEKVLGFSLWQMGFNSINYFSRNLDNLLIGKYFGKTSLGYYDKAYKTTTYAVANFSSIIGSSIQPVLSVHQDDKVFVYERFRKAFLFLVIVGAYLSVSLHLASSEVICFLYGNQWEKAVKAFSFLALSLFAQMSLSITGAFFQVLNNTRLLSLAGCISAGLIVGGISFGIVMNSIEAVAMGYLVAQCINFLVILIILSRLLFRMSFKELWYEIMKTVAVSLCVFVSCKQLFWWWDFSNVFFSLLYKMGASGILFFVLAYVTKIERHVLVVVFPKYKRKIKEK